VPAPASSDEVGLSAVNRRVASSNLARGANLNSLNELNSRRAFGGLPNAPQQEGKKDPGHRKQEGATECRRSSVQIKPPQSIVVSSEQVPGTLQPSEFVENSSKPLTIPVSHLRGKERPPLVPLSAVRGRAKQTGTWQTMRRDEVADDRKSNADDRRRRDQRRKVAGAPERRS